METYRYLDPLPKTLAALWEEMRPTDDPTELCLAGLHGEALAATADHLTVLRAGLLAAGAPHRTVCAVHPLADLRRADAVPGLLAGRLTLRFAPPDGAPYMERVAFGRVDLDRARVAARMLLRMAAGAASRRPRMPAPPAPPLSSVHHQVAAAAPPAAPASVEESVGLLRTLAHLQAEGLITDVEFQEKKRDVLSRL